MTEPSYLPSSNPRVEPSRFPFRHSLPLQIRFSDIDMLGHLNNNVYMTFFDLGKIEFFCTVLGRRVAAPDLCLVVVHVDCDFLSPSFLGDDLQVWTRVERVGMRSLTLQQRIVDRTTGVTKCVGRTVMAGYDPDTLGSAPVKEEWIDALERFEQRKLREDV